MSELLETIRTDLVAARRTRNNVASNVLRTVIAECEKQAHGTGGQQAHVLTDQEVLGVITKLTKSVTETKALVQKAGRIDSIEEAMKLSDELDLLAGYLPQQLTADELRAVVVQLVESGLNFGKVMAALRENHGGTYDAKQAADLVKEVLAV